MQGCHAGVHSAPCYKGSSAAISLRAASSLSNLKAANRGIALLFLVLWLGYDTQGITICPFLSQVLRELEGHSVLNQALCALELKY